MGMSAEEKAAWLSARAGKLTASRMADAMSFLKNGQPSGSRVKLMQELLAERLCDENAPHVVTDAMLHGIEFEDEAVDMFAARFPKYRIARSKFYEHPTIPNFGATPDRELDDGLLEVKCPTTPKFLGWVLNGIVPQEHRPQMTAQLVCTGKQWCGFLAYDPRIRDESKRLFMRKFTPTDTERAEIELAANDFLTELDAMFDAFVTA